VSIERIDEGLCTGCGICADSCPMDVIRMEEEGSKAAIRYPEDCSLCAMCEVDCPQGAIYVGPAKETVVTTCWGL
jgi:NAD-dependent dihydropyrimidine dehydrogenase PreA subunit